MKLLYTGFDTFDVSFKGALSVESRDTLLSAREAAAKQNEDVLTAIGPGNVEMHVKGHGAKGGYAFITDTGPIGEGWMFKNSLSPSQWNISVSVRAAALAAYGYAETKARLQQRLQDMGCIVVEESVRRADFAMDFLMPTDFELKLEQFVAHGHCKVSPHWGEQQTSGDPNKPSAVFRGRQLQSATIGKMPGRQIIVYDKRAAAIEKNNFFWFKVWGIDRDDKSKAVWRVELRAGKKHLKEQWRVATFKEFEATIGDIYCDAAKKVRYVDDFQSDSNITRQQPHPLWEAMQETLQQSLLDFRSGLLPDQLRQIEREQARETYKRLIIGNCAGLGATYEMSDAEVQADLADDVRDLLANTITNPNEQFDKRLGRARHRLHFVTK